MSPRVFLSHKKCDAEWTKTLAGHLRLAGIKVFIDEDMSIEDFWRSELDSQAASTSQLDHYFVLVATPEAVASKEVFREVEQSLAATAGERFLTLLYRDTPMPAGWRLKQSRRIGDPSQYDAVVRDLVQVIKGKTALRKLPRDLSNPNYSEARRLPCDLRRKMLELLKRWCLDRSGYRGLQNVIGTRRDKVPERYRDFRETDPILLASVALVHSMSEDLDPYEQAVAKLESVCRELLNGDEDDAAGLALIREIEKRAASEPRGGSPFAAYLATLERETRRLLIQHLRPGELDDADGRQPRLLSEVCVDIGLDAKSGSAAVAAVRERVEESRERDSGAGWRLTLERLLLRDAQRSPSLLGRYVLRGHPGTGKSTALRAFAHRIASRGADAPLIPVLFSLPELARARRHPEDDLTRRGWKPEELAPLRAALEQKGAKLVLLFDGLDEIAEPADRVWIEEQLRGYAERYADAQIVVATRKIAYEAFAPGLFLDLDLQPLDRGQQRELLVRWFRTGTLVERPEDLAARVLHDLDSGGFSFSELREVPLLLSFVAMLYERREEEPGFRIQGTRIHLYSDILDYLQQGKSRPTPTRLEPHDRARRALQLLARYATESDTSELRRGDLESELYRHWGDGEQLHELSKAYPGPHGPSDFLREVARLTGILGGGNDAGAPWSFWHRSLREALLAEWLVELLHSDDGERQVFWLASSLGSNVSRWGEAFAMFCGSTPDPDFWVRRVHEANHLLAYRSLAGLEKFHPDTVELILDTGGKATSERCQTILQLPSRIDDGVSAATLLGRLAARCADTQELWSIERALHEVRRLHVDAARAVDAALGRLFEHSSFGKRRDAAPLSVPGHPQHAYWRRVPAGTKSSMGSPGDEAGRSGEEGPQVEICFERAFEIAAIPVTNAQYQEFRPEHRFEVGHEDFPAVELSWFDAAMYGAWFGARLPSEAEWECAARAGTRTRFWSGNEEQDLARVGWYCENSDGRSQKVARKPCNGWGLFDVHGNVWNWCADGWYGSHGRLDEGKLSEQPSSVWFRVMKGGAFLYRAPHCRPSFHLVWPPAYRDHDVGFRLARFVDCSSESSSRDPR